MKRGSKVHDYTRLCLSALLMSAPLWFIPPLHAQQSYPMLMSISPVAIQIGTTTECEIESRYSLYGTYKIFVSGEGVVGEVDPPAALKPGEKRPNVGKLKVRFKVAGDAVPGVRDVRLATPLGVSTLGQLVVARDPIVRETTSNNDSMKAAQTIPIPCTVCGAIEKREDVDYYKFHVDAATTLTFHVRCHRLQERIHDLQEMADPILTLKNAAGATLASDDNTFTADPLLVYRFDREGDYYLEIRDVRYLGDRYWQYSIEINDRPFVTTVFPSRVTPGKTTTLQLVGHNLPPAATASLTLPSDTPDGLRWAVLQLPDGRMTNAAPIIASRLPETVESTGDKSTPDKAQKITLPSGVCGRIEKEGEKDCYAFEAKAGERFTFTIVAQDHQSALDSVLRILNDKGAPLAENDDYGDPFNHADSRIENWAAPADGRYVLEVRDLHGRGGPGFVYFLKAEQAVPHFTLDADTDKTPIAPGTANVIYVRAKRHNGFAGEIQLAVHDLPAGVTADCGRILAGGRDGCIVLHAPSDATLAAGNIRITGTATEIKDGKAVTITATARSLQEFYSPGGGRGHVPVDWHTVSICEPLDLRAVKLSTKEITLKPGESKTIEVTIERSPDFKQNVLLAASYQHLGNVTGDSMPTGVIVDDKSGRTLLAVDQSKGAIVIKAAPDAKPVEKQQIAIMAQVSINFVMKFTYAEVVYVSVAKP
jgi:hypothetical protein